MPNLIHRTRTLRPSTRKATSKSYKVGLPKDLSTTDSVQVTILHEAHPNYRKVYAFAGKDLIGKSSISFGADSEGNIVWYAEAAGCAKPQP